jgi:hypothetical protein
VPLNGLMKRYDDFSLYLYPFTLDLTAARQFITAAEAVPRPPHTASLLCLHMPVVNALFGNSRKCETGLDLTDFDLSKWDAVLLGHYHKPQCLDRTNKVHYIGSPYQVDRAEAGEHKRFMVWIPSGSRGAVHPGRLDSVPVADVPEFMRLSVLEYVELSDREKQLHFIELEVNTLEEVRTMALPPNVVPVHKREAQADVPVPTSMPTGFGLPDAVRQWMLDHGAPEEQAEEAVTRLAQD